MFHLHSHSYLFVYINHKPFDHRKCKHKILWNKIENNTCNVAYKILLIARVQKGKVITANVMRYRESYNLTHTKW